MNDVIQFESELKKEIGEENQEPLYSLEDEQKDNFRYCKIEKTERKFVERVGDPDTLLCCNCSFITSRRIK